MQKIVVLIISFVVFTDILIQISNTKSVEYNRRNFFRLRTFAIHSLKTLRDIRKAQEMEQQIKKKAERQMAKAQEELQRYKENLLSKIFTLVVSFKFKNKCIFFNLLLNQSLPLKDSAPKC
jgi:hypothetical protein